MTLLITLAGLDFWQWVAVLGLALTTIGVGLGGLALVKAGRQTKGLTDQIGATTQLIKGASEGTHTLITEMHTATQATLGQLGQVLDRMDRAAEARYRDLKDHLDGEAERP